MQNYCQNYGNGKKLVRCEKERRIFHSEEAVIVFENKKRFREWYPASKNFKKKYCNSLKALKIIIIKTWNFRVTNHINKIMKIKRFFIRFWTLCSNREALKQKSLFWKTFISWESEMFCAYMILRNLYEQAKGFQVANVLFLRAMLRFANKRRVGNCILWHPTAVIRKLIWPNLSQLL